MEKFNYKITVEAPSKKIADMLMEHICKDNIDLLQLITESEEVFKKAPAPEPEIKKPSEKENFLKGLMQFERVIQIIERCVTDETALDRIAQVLGIKTQKPTHE